MKKRLFDIDSDEVLRILSLHEERTKNQYLNIISEQKKQTITTSKDYTLSPYGGGDYLTLLSKSIFNITDKPNVVSAKNIKIQVEKNGQKTIDTTKKYISYYCDQKKFFVQGGVKPGYGNDDLGKYLSANVCGDKSGGTDKSSKDKQGKTYTQAGSHTFTIYKDYNAFKEAFQDKPEFKKGDKITIKANTVWNWNPTGKRLVTNKPVISKKYAFKNKEVGEPTLDLVGVFYCGKGFHLYNYKYKLDMFIVDDDKKLTAQLNKQFCTSSDSGAGAGAGAGEGAGAGSGAGSGTDSSQFTQDVVNTNTQIQTSLGVQTPTGQITDADIEAILAKLG